MNDYIVVELKEYPDVDKPLEGYPEHRITLVTGLGPYLVVLRRKSE